MRSQSLSDLPVEQQTKKPSGYYGRTSTYSDIDLNFRPNPVTGDLTSIKDTESVKASVMNLIMTSFNERPFQPEVGSGVRGLLFEPADPITIFGIEEAVKRVIKNFEPRVRILDIQSIFYEDNNAYELTLTFQIITTQQIATTTLVLERLR